MLETADKSRLDVVRELGRASVLLNPLRLRILRELREADSASGLSRRLGPPRQKLNYHLRRLPLDVLWRRLPVRGSRCGLRSAPQDSVRLSPACSRPRSREDLKPQDFAQIATEYVLESEGGTTLLRLVHPGFGTESEWDDQFEGTRTGWEVELRGLRHFLESHRGRDRVVAWAKAPFTTSRATAWDRILSSRGLLAEGTLEGAREGSRYRIRAANGDRFEGTLELYDPPAEFRCHGRALESGSPAPAPGGSLRAARSPRLAFDLRSSTRRGGGVPDAMAGRAREPPQRMSAERSTASTSAGVSTPRSEAIVTARSTVAICSSRVRGGTPGQKTIPGTWVSYS